MTHRTTWLRIRRSTGTPLPCTHTECPYEPDEILSVKWEASFIFLSYVYAMMGAYLTVMCIRRLFNVRDFKWFLALSTIAGLGLGGCGVWTMHFVGMKALFIGNKDIEISVNGDTKQVTAVLEVEFEVFMTVFSLLAACAISSAGVAWISYRDFLSMGRTWNAPEARLPVPCHDALSCACPALSEACRIDRSCRNQAETLPRPFPGS